MSWLLSLLRIERGIADKEGDFVIVDSSSASELGIGVCDCGGGIQLGVRAVAAEHVFDEGDETGFVVFDTVFWGCDWGFTGSFSGSFSDVWKCLSFVLQTVLGSSIVAMFLLQNLASNTVLYMYCKALHGELAGAIAKEFAREILMNAFKDSVSYNVGYLKCCKGTTTIGAADDGCSENHGILSPIKDTSLEKVVDDIADEVVKNGATSPTFNGRNDLEIGGSWSHASAVEETQDCLRNSNEEGTCVVESSLPKERVQQLYVSNVVKQIGAEATIIGNNYNAQLDVVAPSTFDHLPTSGFIKSLSEPLQVGPSINLEVSLGLVKNGLQPISGQQPIGPSGEVSQPLGPAGAGLNHTPSSEVSVFANQTFSDSTRHRIKKGKKRGIRSEGLKNTLLLGRFTGIARRFGQKGIGSSKGTFKGSISRPSAVSQSSQHM
ncbi:hypothetical protein LOK49_LG03G00649 [Camellia lanceoleosa]|uniref:Uncharacterized protein n=1 Tax=Camellia lanceoleosa TaxID=1840588 RepID=A0ACC0IEL4_9ERIC|nr:hypothetical protein LOK49_LG03G00649 [Camellia lanceoleosa]